MPLEGDYLSKINNGHLAVLYTVEYAPVNAGKPAEYGVTVLDLNLNERWTRRIELPYKRKLIDIVQHNVYTDGSVRILTKVYRDKRREQRKGVPNWEYHFLVFKNDGQEFEDYVLPMKDKFYTDLVYYYMPNGDIECTGFYSGRNAWDIKGVFSVIIGHENNEIKKEQFKPFSEDFVDQVLEETDTKKEKTFFSYRIDERIKLPDGSTVFVTEQYHSFTLIIQQEFGNKSATDYYFNDIILLKMDAEGNLDWIKSIPKKQRVQRIYTPYCSYGLTRDANAMYFVFNDHPNNLNSASGKVKTMGNPKNAALVYVKVDYDGNVFPRKELLNAKDLGMMIRTNRNATQGEASLILRGEKGKKLQIGKVVF